MSMNEHHSEDDLEFLNCLLERLHQAGFDRHGSHIEIVIVQSGAQHVDHVENQYFCGNTKVRENATEGSDKPELPPVLATEAAMTLWQKAQRAGYVDDDYQPTISRTQSALLADAMAERLGIRETWKVFETLWNRKNMYKDYYQAGEQKQFLPFQDKLKRLFD